MEGGKYKILVLSNLKDAPEAMLKSAVALSEAVNAEIKLFHVKKPTDVVERESQLSTFRTINEQHSLTKGNIDNLVSSVSKHYKVALDYGYAFGNIKNEIEAQMETYRPDIVILGKRKAKIGIAGDKVVNFVMKAHKGSVFVLNNQNFIEPNKAFSVAILSENPTNYHDDELANNLIERSQKPIKLFEITSKTSKQESSKADVADNEIKFVFERNNDTVGNLLKYVLKNKVSLLYVSKKSKNKGGLKKSDIKDIINKTEVPIFIPGDY